ncbi:uncharacterized protein LOC134282301 [Saccostrea cucullata]|uniref:uncharacterized protein LOC134282301 n=1 Tax=Saccostrea cuccullata TaxID=36930 RepID=UPI002ED6B6A0
MVLFCKKLPKHSSHVSCILEESVAAVLNKYERKSETLDPSAQGIQECKESLGTVRRVDYCPSNERSWKEAEFKKGCGNIKQDCVDSKRFLYHCILTDMMNETIEVCAPIRVMFGYCPVYTLIGAKIHHNYARKCQQLFKPCPEDFESNNLHQYPECLELPTGPTLNPDPPASYSERMHFTKRR